MWRHVAPWCSGYHYCTTSLIKAWTQVLRRFNPARSVSEIRDGEDLWQWSRLEIRLNAFRRSTIPQKQFIFIIIISHTSINKQLAGNLNASVASQSKRREENCTGGYSKGLRNQNGGTSFKSMRIKHPWNTSHIPYII